MQLFPPRQSPDLSGSALGLLKTFLFKQVFSPRHSSSKLGSALGLSKTFLFKQVSRLDIAPSSSVPSSAQKPSLQCKISYGDPANPMPGSNRTPSQGSLPKPQKIGTKVRNQFAISNAKRQNCTSAANLRHEARAARPRRGTMSCQAGFTREDAGIEHACERSVAAAGRSAQDPVFRFGLSIANSVLLFGRRSGDTIFYLSCAAETPTRVSTGNCKPEKTAATKKPGPESEAFKYALTQSLSPHETNVFVL